MAHINQNISNFPTPPDSSTDTPQQFNAKANAFVAHQANVYTGEVNTWATEANALRDDINSIVGTIPTGTIDDTAPSLTKVFSSQKTRSFAPAGMLFDFAGTSAPVGALECNGQELDKTAYPELYTAIGDNWNTTNGVTTAAGKFRVPPQEVGGLGLYTRGVGATNGAVGTYQGDVFKKHSHYSPLGGLENSTYRYDWGTRPIFDTGTSVKVLSSSTSSYDSWLSDSEAVGDTTETRPRSITVLKCIWTGK